MGRIPEISEHRAEAQRLLLAAIDNSQRDLKGVKEQKELLDSLIEQHNLRHYQFLKNGTRDKEEVPLTTEPYKNQLRQITLRHGNIIDGRRAGAQDVFERGSAVITDDYLARIGYERPSHVAAEGDGDDGNGDGTDENQGTDTDEDETESDEVQVGVAAKAPVKTTRESAAPKSAPNKITSNSTALLTLHNNKKVLSTPSFSPLSPLEIPSSPQLDTAAATKKRKRSSEDTGEPKRSVIRDSRGSDTIDLTTGGTPNAEGIQPEIGTSSKAPAKPTTSARTFNPSASLVKLSDNDVMAQVEGCWGDVQDVARKFLKAGQVDGSSRAALVLRPQPELEAIYKTIFGEKNWRGAAGELILEGVFTARDAMEACIGAAAFCLAYMPDLPFKGPKGLMNGLSQIAEQIDVVLRETDPKLRLHTVVWQAAANQMQSQEFREEVIRPYAEELAEKFMLMIAPQLDALGANPNIGGTKAARQHLMGDVTGLFSRMIQLKGQLRSAPDYYQVRWVENGEPVTGFTEELHKGNGPQKVAWAVSPLVKKQARRDVPWMLVHRAKVFSQQIK